MLFLKNHVYFITLGLILDEKNVCRSVSNESSYDLCFIYSFILFFEVWKETHKKAILFSNSAQHIYVHI